MPLMQGKDPIAFKHNIKAEMKSGKPQNQALAIAYSIKKRSKKMAAGGMVNEKLHPEHEPMILNPRSIAEKIRAKKMAMGGEAYEDGGMVDYGPGDDFLSDEQDEHAINLAYPDPDDMEDTEGMGPEEEAMQRRKMRISQIMSR